MFSHLYKQYYTEYFSGMTFIFASLIELAIIGFLNRNEGRPPDIKLKQIRKKVIHNRYKH